MISESKPWKTHKLSPGNLYNLKGTSLHDSDKTHKRMSMFSKRKSVPVIDAWSPTGWTKRIYKYPGRFAIDREKVGIQISCE